MQVLHANGDFFDLLALFLALKTGAHDFAADGRQLAVKFAYTGFARVVGNHALECRVGNRKVFFRQAAFCKHARDQMLLGDVQLFLWQIAGELEHIHAVEQRGWNCVRHVGSGDEKYVTEIDGNFQIMVSEVTVLLRVKHFQQSAGRIAAEIGPDLVDFVEQHDRI